MTRWKLILAGLAFHARMNFATACGVAAAAAVLTGALLVGDSVRGSLKTLALDRLGRIDELLVADRFFREELATELAARDAFQKEWAQASPAVLFPTALVETSAEKLRRASDVLVFGGRADLWDFADAAVRPAKPPAEDEVILNEPLAHELGVKVGDAVTLRFSKLAQVPADSPLGRKTGRVQSLPDLKVAAIIPARSLGRFSLTPNQGTVRVAFVSLAALQDALEQPARANAILVASKNGDQPPDAAASERLQALLQPQLIDFGLAIKHVTHDFGVENDRETILNYFSLSSERMLIDPAAEEAALSAWESHRPHALLTYLANSIEKVLPGPAPETPPREGSIPYSTVAAIEPFVGGPLVPDAEHVFAIQENEIALTSWAAEDLQVKLGDKIRVRYFEPESAHGDEVETSAEFTLGAIVPLTEPTQAFNRRKPAVYSDRPTTANDPDVTPEVKGITDQDSIADWDAPFPFDQRRVRSVDDTFWENHRTTPKAYVRLAAGQKLWKSRFGDTTSIRVEAADGVTAETLAKSLEEKLVGRGAELGLEFRAVKRLALAASSGTTPFDVLFLLLSQFIIAAALLLAALLFRLSVEQRGAELGLLQATGWTPRAAVRVFLAEGAVVAALGSLVGATFGVGYSAAMIHGLRTWWIGAVATPFLTLHITPQSLVIGFVAGFVASLLAIWFSARRLKQVSVRRLLAGRIEDDPSLLNKHRGRQRLWFMLFAALAVLLIPVAASLQGEAAGGAGLAAGAAFVAAAISYLRLNMNRESFAGRIVRSPVDLSVRNIGRNPTRSLVTIALMAAATFLILAVSAFRLTPTREGVGGFDFTATSSEPIVHNFNSPRGREELLGPDADQLTAAKVFSFRLQPGDDAGCRNLYQSAAPRVLGVTPDFATRFNDPEVTRFRFAASAATSPEEKANPWRLLAGDAPAEGAVPVILDKNTAMYGLRLYQGIGEEFTRDYGAGQTVKFRVVGLLAESVLQGSLLVGEGDFKRLFPRQSGYRFFLISAPEKPAEVADLLEDRLGDEGFDAVDAKEELVELFAVQNTYISTFQSLGALGLLLGTFGLAAVQLRNILERRGELALLRAVGFSDAKLAQLVVGENLVLVAGGLAIGAAAAAFALAPQLASGAAQIPWLDSGLMLLATAFVGLLVSLIAVRAVLKAPVIAALRGE